MGFRCFARVVLDNSLSAEIARGDTLESLPSFTDNFRHLRK